MYHDLNRVEVLGHLSQDPEMRVCADGPVTTFSVATNRPTKPDSAPETDWHRVVCFGKRAEFAGRYLKKGHPIFVEGRLIYSTWEGRDGQKHRTAEIQARELISLGRFPDAEPDAPGSVDDADPSY